jgi:hypothetical protein
MQSHHADNRSSKLGIIFWGLIVNIKSIIGSALVLGCLASASAFAQTCSVQRISAPPNVFFVPSGGPTPGSYNILGWGNGTGGGATTYNNLLNAAAQRCVLVAAATTANSGNGTEVAAAVAAARSRFANILRSPLVIGTSGHSQGGGGSFNAANVIGPAATVVIALQPDTRFTTRINRPVARNVDVTCIFGNRDSLAPASGNAANCRNNSTIYRQVTVSASHLNWINQAGGGTVGVAQRVQIDRLLR